MLKNNYTKNVYNGQEGTILTVDAKGIETKFDDQVVFFYWAPPVEETVNNDEIDSNSYKALKHSWVLSVEKSQGSEWPCVITVLPQQDSNFLTRERFYVCLTRSMAEFVLFGPSKVISSMINRPSSRGQTALTEKFRPVIKLDPTLTEKVGSPTRPS